MKISNKSVKISILILTLIVLFSTLTYAKPFTDAFKGGLMQINDFFSKEQYKAYAKTIDFFFFALLFTAIYMMGARYAFKEMKNAEKAIVILLGLMTSFLMVLGGFSATLILPYIQWILYTLLFIFYWWLLKGIKSKFWRFVLALLLTLLSIALFQGLFNSLTAPDAEGFFKSLGKSFSGIQFPGIGWPGVPDYLSNLFSTTTPAPTGPETLPPVTTPTAEAPGKGGIFGTGASWWWLLLLLLLLLLSKRIRGLIARPFRGISRQRAKIAQIIQDIESIIRKKGDAANNIRDAHIKKIELLQDATRAQAYVQGLTEQDLANIWTDDARNRLRQEKVDIRDILDEDFKIIDGLKALRAVEKELFNKLNTWKQTIQRERSTEDITAFVEYFKKLIGNKASVINLQDLNNVGIIQLIELYYDIEKKDATLNKEIDVLLEENNIEALMKDKFVKLRGDQVKLRNYMYGKTFVLKELLEKISNQIAKLNELLARLRAAGTTPTLHITAPPDNSNFPLDAGTNRKKVIFEAQITNLNVTAQSPATYQWIELQSQPTALTFETLQALLGSPQARMLKEGTATSANIRNEIELEAGSHIIFAWLRHAQQAILISDNHVKVNIGPGGRSPKYDDTFYGERIKLDPASEHDDPQKPDEEPFVPEVTTITGNVDLSPHFLPIKNQKTLSACTAFAVGSAFEYLYNKDRAEPDLQKDISELFLYWYARDNKNNDTGAHISTACERLVQNGVCLEPFWPYIVENYSQQPDERAQSNAQKQTLKTHYLLPENKDDLKKTLFSRYPVAIAIFVRDDFYGVTTNFYSPNMSLPKNGGHAMVVVGYNSEVDTPDGKGAFKIRNSWGSKWGENGYVWVQEDRLVELLRERANPSRVLTDVSYKGGQKQNAHTLILTPTNSTPNNAIEIIGIHHDAYAQAHGRNDESLKIGKDVGEIVLKDTEVNEKIQARIVFFTHREPEKLNEINRFKIFRESGSKVIIKLNNYPVKESAFIGKNAKKLQINEYIFDIEVGEKPQPVSILSHRSPYLERFYENATLRLFGVIESIILEVMKDIQNGQIDEALESISKYKDKNLINDELYGGLHKLLTSIKTEDFVIAIDVLNEFKEEGRRNLEELGEEEQDQGIPKLIKVVENILKIIDDLIIRYSKRVIEITGYDNQRISYIIHDASKYELYDVSFFVAQKGTKKYQTIASHGGVAPNRNYDEGYSGLPAGVYEFILRAIPMQNREKVKRQGYNTSITIPIIKITSPAKEPIPKLHIGQSIIKLESSPNFITVSEKYGKHLSYNWTLIQERKEPFVVDDRWNGDYSKHKIANYFEPGDATLALIVRDSDGKIVSRDEIKVDLEKGGTLTKTSPPERPVRNIEDELAKDNAEEELRRIRFRGKPEL